MSATNTHTELIANRYELGAVIGKGGMGEVRRGRDNRLGRDVAVKFLRPDLAAQPQVRQRFESEARSAGQLTHPNVVTVYDSGEHNGVPYIVMECLPGRSLRDEIAKGPVPEDFARVIALDVLAGLEAAHAAGIVHRDVAPANILLTDDGRAKVADFGIAKAGEAVSTTMAGQIVGTPAYLSPARLQGAPALPADDIYALGVVMYEAVTGQRLFSGSTPIAVAQTVLNSPPPPVREIRPELSPSFAAAVDGAMAREPSLRLTTADEVRRTLEGGTVDQTVLAGVAAAETAAMTTTMPVVERTTMASAAPARTRSGVPFGEMVRRTPREVWLMIAAVAFVGILLLSLANRSSNDPLRTDDTTLPGGSAETPSPTTFAPTPTTEVTIAPAVNVDVGGRRVVVGGDGDDDGGKAKGRGKKND